MPRILEVLTENLQEHPAVRAWSQLSGERVAPDSIQVLKRKQKSAAYRLDYCTTAVVVLCRLPGFRNEAMGCSRAHAR